LSYLTAILSILFFTHCSSSLIPRFSRPFEAYDLGRTDTAGQPDYGNLAYWAAHPDKHSPADSIPTPLREGSIEDTTVDVFFLHPTTLTDPSAQEWNADLGDSALNARTDRTTILFQASAFNECRVFAPRYRQAHLRAYFTKDTVSARRAFDLAYSDLRNAFQYYLDHYNHGRPIIIASHSQGSTHAQRLLREFFQNKPLQQQLVAAYIIGMAIPRDSFPDLPPCRDSASTGCLIGWRTYKKGFEPDFVQAEHGSSLVVNPLAWTTNEEYAPRSLNKGGILRDFDKLVPGVVDAQIHDGVLWVSRPRFPGSFLIRTGNYHIGDINLFYLNIRENIRTRIRHYWMGQGRAQ
jgi:Protein of unknown function (DUF3089)